MKRKNSIMWSRLGVVALLMFLLAPGAFADLVTMSIGWGANGPGDIYSPYPGHISEIGGSAASVDVFVACLDYHLNTYVNTDYTYDRTFNSGPSVAPPSGGATAAHYDLAAKLFAKYSSTPNMTLRIQMNEAIWHIFDASVGATAYGILVPLVSADPTPFYTVYTPTVYYPPVEGEVHTQRFLSVPDGGMTLMLLGGALVGLETLRRRFRA